jgi:RNA polymerase sigma-70 factor (ECF subfamily)
MARLFEMNRAVENIETDESLMARIVCGDQQAFALLVRRHSKLFFTAAYRMCHQEQEAEDIVQEAFMKLWSRPDIFDAAKGVKFTTWFYRVVTNLAIDKTRRRKPQVKSEVLDFLADQTPRVDDRMVDLEQQTAIETAISSLPERQKAALNLCFYEGLSNKDAAEILGVGIKALESLLMRAKKTLREDLIQSGAMNKNDNQRRSSYAG